MINTDCVVKNQVWRHVEDHVWDQVRYQASNHVEYQVEYQVWQVRDQVCYEVWLKVFR